MLLLILSQETKDQLSKHKHQEFMLNQEHKLVEFIAMVDKELNTELLTEEVKEEATVVAMETAVAKEEESTEAVL